LGDIDRGDNQARAHGIIRLGKVPFAFVAGAAALTVTLFQLHDRIWPPVTVHGGEVVAADLVQLDVTYVDYVHTHKHLYPDEKRALRAARIAVNTRGAIVEVVLQMRGLRGRHCIVQYSVYRLPLTRVIGPEAALTECTATVRDGDEGGWPAWVQLPRSDSRAKVRSGNRYFIRFGLYDNNGLLIGPGKSTAVFTWNGG
jgi:hypothetical protein